MRKEISLAVYFFLTSKIKQFYVVKEKFVNLSPILMVRTALTYVTVDVRKILYIRNRSLICCRFHCSYLSSYENRLSLHLRHYSLRVGHFEGLPPTSISGIVVERSGFSGFAADCHLRCSSN